MIFSSNSNITVENQNSEDMLTTSEPTKNLGKLKFGRPVPFNFQIKNETNRRVEITKIVVGCGSCTKAQIIKTKLEPEEESTISVVFTPGSTGQQKKHITVKYDADSVLKLEFTAEVYA
jgi:hypothetical protein